MATKRKNSLWVGAITGFIIGVCGNLVAAWIQQDVLSSSFTPLRIGLIVLCSLVGIAIMVRLEERKGMTTVKEKVSSEKTKNFYAKIKLAWSKLRTRGKGIHMEDVSAVGSDIDIDTK